jgi:hypothetical protein
VCFFLAILFGSLFVVLSLVLSRVPVTQWDAGRPVEIVWKGVTYDCVPRHD